MSSKQHGEFRLPDSGLRVSYSTRHYRFGADTGTAVVPDVTIQSTWQQFAAWRDTVLEWILAQPVRRAATVPRASMLPAPALQLSHPRFQGFHAIASQRRRVAAGYLSLCPAYDCRRRSCH